MLCVVIRMIYNFIMKLPVCKCNSQLCNHLVAPLAFSFGSYFEELCKLTLMSAVTWHKKKNYIYKTGIFTRLVSGGELQRPHHQVQLYF